MLANKKDLIKDLAAAIDEGQGFALGKTGFSEQHLLGYLSLINSNPPGLRQRAYEAVLRYHCEKQMGLFPVEQTFLVDFAGKYLSYLQRLDYLGLFGAGQETKLISDLGLDCKFLNYMDTEPDRSIPGNPELCYLPLFKNKKVLLIAPFAALLKERANQTDYENVWDSIGKKWFFPESTSAIEFPYSYVTEVETHRKFGTSLNLYKHICKQISNESFDIALIAAGALGIPLAAFVKSIGRVGLSLGGQLQVIFGIAGKRWRDDQFYAENYINQFWIDMPALYHPQNKESLTDSGAYW
jgi:hypothetical protein